MASNDILNWPGGAGWLILSAGPTDDLMAMGDIRATALTRMVVDGGVAYIGLDEDDHEDLIEEMGELGAPTGYLVNVMTEDDDTIKSTLADSGMILITGDYDAAQWRPVLMGAALKGIEACYAQGGIIIAEGPAATMFGAVIENGAEGFNWLEKAFIVPGVESISESLLAREVLADGKAEVAVGIGLDSALALGPERHIETWGTARVTVALGRGKNEPDQ